MSLQDEIKKDLDIYESSASQNYMAVYVLSLVAVVASFFAGLSVALDWFGKSILAVLSALPAGVLLCSDRLKLEEKATWYWGIYYELDGVYSAMLHEGLSESDASKQRTAIQKEYHTKWPGFGAPPKGAEPKKSVP